MEWTPCRAIWSPQRFLFYNHQFLRPRSPRADWAGSYTAAFDPDYSIVVRASEGVTHWRHFGAKCRRERQQAEAMLNSCDDGDDESNASGRLIEVLTKLVSKHGAPPPCRPGAAA